MVVAPSLLSRLMINRRRFSQAFAAAVATVSVAGCAATPETAPAAPAGPAASPTLVPSGPSKNAFGPLKYVNAGELNIGYAESGPADGPVVICLHGWPYDIQSYVDVAPLLVAAGYRVIVPYLRGYGTTTFLAADTFRNGQQAVVALDIIALMDALKIEKAVLAGFDWGARTAGVIAALWPQRVKALVAVSGYLVTSLKAKPAAPATAGGAGLVVPVLLLHRARPARLRRPGAEARGGARHHRAHDHHR